MADIKYSITVDSAGAIKNVQNFDKAVEALGKTTTTGAKPAVQSFGQELSSKLIPSFTAATLAADVIKKSLGLVKREFGDSIKQAADYEKAVKGLEAAFAISGRTMPGMVANLKKYAGELEKLGLAEDDEIIRAESLLLQFTDLNEKGIQAATRGAIGLASVYTMDLQSAAAAVKNGIEGNYRALSMLIPEIRNATTEEGKRAAMMKGFEELYARAIADTQTYAGQVKQLGLEWKSAKQEFGEAALQTGILQEGILMLREGLEELTAWGRRKTMAQVIAENNAAGVSLGKLAKSLGWAKNDMTLLRLETGYSSSELLGMAKANWLGEEAAKALAKILADEAAELAKTKKGFTETGEGAKETAVKVSGLAERFGELNDELRWFRMLGKMNIFAPIKNSLGTLGDMVGGTTGKVIDFQETVPGLFTNLTTGTAAAAEGAVGMSEVWDSAMMSMTAGLVSFGDANATIWGNIGAIFGNFIQSAIGGIEAMVIKEIWAARMTTKAKQNEATGSHIANIFKSVPFPFDLILAAGAFAVVNALFSKLLKFEHGGVFTKPTLAEIGHGTEYVLPEKKLIQIVQMAQVAAPGGASGFGGRSLSIAAIHIHVAQTTTAADIRRLGPAVYGAVKDEFRLRGYNLEKR
jgi:hypothetical protein